MNNWNIPNWLEKEVRNRDKICVYCWVEFSESEKKKTATWEHIINDETIISRENIALCCCSCNASKWAKLLWDWLNSKYCKERNINSETVSFVIKQALWSEGDLLL
jgi:hypothetical protein